MASVARINELYNTYNANVRKFLRAVHRLDDADLEDIAQEVFLRLLRYPTDEITDPQAYLFRIASNVTNEWRNRSRQRRPHLGLNTKTNTGLNSIHEDTTDEEEDIAEFMDANPTPEELVSKEADERHLRQLLVTLTPNQREALIDHANGLNYFQIAAKHKRTYRMVLRDIVKGYTTLRKEFKRS